MTHTSFQGRGGKKRFDFEADYVVVGSGAGGAVAAVTLARGGARVALVEAGAWLDPEDYPSSTYGCMRDLMLDWSSLLVRGRALWPVVQGRVMGGSTVINSAICVRTPGDIFTQWKNEFGIGGEAFANTIWEHQDALETEMHAEVVPLVSLGRSNLHAKAGGDAMGYKSHYMTRYTRGCEGRGQCLQGCRAKKKQSTNLHMVPEVLERGGQVLSCAPVSRIRFKENRAIGVEGQFLHPKTKKKGANFRVVARRGVIVAASAAQSAPLLMRSGVRSPALGEGFRAHPGTGVFGIYDEPVDMNLGATQGWASTAFRENPGLKLETLAIPPEMAASRISGGGKALMRKLEKYRHLAMWCHAVRAETAGTVRPGLFGKSQIRYTFIRRDMERLRQGIHLVAKTHFAAGAKAVIPGAYGLPSVIEADQVDQILEGPLDPRAYVAILSHIFGGCTMGTDPSRSVTDERGWVHGYQSLMVADAAVIPTNLGVNPQHTIMALARHFASTLLEDPPDLW